MKKLMRFALPLIILGSFYGCKKEAGLCTEITVYTEDSRTELSFPSILWTEDDAIVVNGKTSTAVSIQPGGCKATFTIPPSSAPYYGFYPASAFVPGSYAPASSKFGSIVLPEKQTWVENSFDPAAALMTGYSTTSFDMSFSCATAFMKITVNGSSDLHDIKRIEITANGGEDMSGTLGANGKNGYGVIVSYPSGIPQGKAIYASIAPGTYASGISLRIVDINGHFQDLKSNRPFTAGAGTVYPTSITFIPTGTIIDGSTGETDDPSGKQTYTEFTKHGTLIRTSVADPCLNYVNGLFYLTMTGSSNISMIVDTDLDKLTTAIHPVNLSNRIYQSSSDDNVKAMFGDDAEINGTWSPEVHYFSEADFPGRSGWYMFLGLRKKYIVDGTALSTYIRMVVLKSLSDGQEGPYGHPESGIPNLSQELLGKNGGSVAEWGCGTSVLRIPSGQYAGIYALWVEEEGRGTGYGNFFQKIMIAKMSSPWQISTDPAVVTTPTQNWEKAGADNTFPMVVEGATAIYGDHGEIFLAYCGSGYWSNYGLGQLTLAKKGNNYTNPLLTSSWIKYNENPVFSSKESSDLRGAGHAFFLKDDKGNRFMCYHAYPFVDGQKASARNAYMEPYTIDYNDCPETAPQGVLRLGLQGNGVSAPVENSSFKFYLGFLAN